VTPSRVFALWLALLMLYFLILPTAAETTEGGVQTSAGANQTLNTTVGVARR
jgi:hypothetical protein